MGKAILKDISQALATKRGMSPAEADRYIDAFFSVIEEGLSVDKVVKIKGFGTFKLVEVKDRESVDVNTGERVVIEGHSKISFTPENALKELVNKPFSQFETVELNEGVEFDKEINLSGLTTSYSDNSDDVASEFVESETQGYESVNNEKSTVNPIAETLEVSIHPETEKEEPSSNEQEDSSSVENVNADLKTDSTSIVVAVADKKVVDSMSEINNDERDCQNETLDNINEPNVENANTTSEKSADILTENNEETLENEIGDIDKPAQGARIMNIIAYTFVLLVLVVGMFFVGFYFGERRDSDTTTIVQEATTLKPMAKKTPIAEKPVVAPNDTTSVYPHKNDNNFNEIKESGPQNGESKKESLDSDDETPALKSAETLVRTGAYTIIGTNKSITVKSGQTIKGLAKRYLGEGMECYIQVYNKKTEVKEGETINIPKLQLKKKGRNKKVS